MFDCKVFIPSVTLSTPTVSDCDTSMWTLTSPDGNRVERYIVEFECRVQNITFVERYMSVSASGGTGRVAINASCFGGLGQLYRVKVWAVSGPNISQALVCVTGVQCRDEGRRATMHVVNMLCMLIHMHYFHYRISVSCKINAHTVPIHASGNAERLTMSMTHYTRRTNTISLSSFMSWTLPLFVNTITEGILFNFLQRLRYVLH